jgi:hypothetical protein
MSARFDEPTIALTRIRWVPEPEAIVHERHQRKPSRAPCRREGDELVKVAEVVHAEVCEA